MAEEEVEVEMAAPEAGSEEEIAASVPAVYLETVCLPLAPSVSRLCSFSVLRHHWTTCVSASTSLHPDTRHRPAYVLAPLRNPTDGGTVITEQIAVLFGAGSRQRARARSYSCL